MDIRVRGGGGQCELQTEMRQGAWQPRALEEVRRGRDQRCPPLRCRPGNLVLDLWPPGQCGNKPVLFSAAKSVIIRYSSPRKLTQVYDMPVSPPETQHLYRGVLAACGVLRRVKGRFVRRQLSPTQQTLPRFTSMQLSLSPRRHRELHQSHFNHRSIIQFLKMSYLLFFCNNIWHRPS